MTVSVKNNGIGGKFILNILNVLFTTISKIGRTTPVVLLIEAIRTISSLFFFFFFFFDEKISGVQKHVTPRSLCGCEKLLSLLFSVSLFLFC